MQKTYLLHTSIIIRIMTWLYVRQNYVSSIQLSQLQETALYSLYFFLKWNTWNESDTRSLDGIGQNSVREPTNNLTGTCNSGTGFKYILWHPLMEWDGYSQAVLHNVYTHTHTLLHTKWKACFTDLNVKIQLSKKTFFVIFIIVFWAWKEAPRKWAFNLPVQNKQTEWAIQLKFSTSTVFHLSWFTKSLLPRCLRLHEML